MAKPNHGPRLALNRRQLWEIRWSENGRSKRKSTGTADKTEAQHALSSFLRQSPVRQVDSVQDCLDLYREGHWLRSVADPKRKESIHRWLSQALGTFSIEQLPREVAGYIQKRRSGVVGAGKAKDSTIRLELGHLSAALQYAVKHKQLSAERVPRIELTAGAKPKDTWLSEAQVDSLLGALERDCDGGRMSRTFRFVVLALASGARKAAIEQLTWAQVERHTGLLRFDRQVIVATNKRKVAVPIADWLVPYLDRMVQEATTELVLDTDACIRSEYEWAMRRVAKLTGDASFIGLTRHALRHTCATLMLRAGTSLWDVAGVLGDTVATVEATYGHHAADALKTATNSWRR